MHSTQQLPEAEVLRVDLAVIGSGPGGYEAALRGAKAGMKVCIIEKAALGGVCINWGCIPTKALLKSAELFESLKNPGTFGFSVKEVSIDLAEAIKRSRNVALKMSKGVAFMLRRSEVEVLQGEARFSSPNDLDVYREGTRVARVHARHIIIASGSRPRLFPGLEPDGNHIITSREALAMKSLPGSMIVVGGGAIGVELAWFYAMAGTAVTLVEMMPRLLPLEDEEISAVLLRSFQKAGITVAVGAKLEGVKATGEGVTALLTVDGREPQPLSADYLLVAIGVTGNCADLGLEHAGVESARGFVVTDPLCRTAAGHIFAIGDVRGGMLLAHKASAEAAIAISAIKGGTPEPLEDSMIPRCVYAEPSVASIGLSEKQAEERGYSVKVGRSMFAASGKANAYGNLEGLVKLVFNAADDRLLGAHLIGHGAVELIGELTLARRLEVTAGLLAGTVHAHPTLSETIREAAESVLQE
ncbi:dihydrolipoyl dehydrogenase [Chlorobium sp. BLA1]|uniref:dihydrolipoyl dehydrogenase n=1 Tax=Candidatus Chlorobium masyuteum TaxID=2716876 RepID=UPI0014238694|nr:dihydrolipoyl dehydrogenase [Candidatus Chlorobium masyuteum]NHQ60857.1 dihydrolipoyl dehydrogenase [Candidatus Chlorobium masyuteum]NTU45775.1 dihydrolipoyl dehydrogenase [Chlorobiaceae bacterium]